MRMNIPSRQFGLMFAVALLAVLSLIQAPYLGTAPLQVGPTFIILAGLYCLTHKWPMPTTAVACVCAFLVLHIIGARYIYSYVPYDEWLAAIGLPKPAQIFGWQRNHFDRLVHFSFGAIMVHPIACALNLHLGVSTRRAIYIAVEFVIATSALYEIFEWILTLTLASADAAAYNGQQGDIWDAQKDMALASCGAIGAALLLYCRSVVNTRRV